MILANIGAFLLTPLLVFPSFGADGDFSAFFQTSRAEAQESRMDRDWGSWWDWRTNPNDDRPEIDAIDPESGAAGAEVTLSGENFSDDSSVRFGNKTIEDVDVSEDGTELTFTIPEDAKERRYNVRVIGDDGRSNAMRFEVTDTEEDDDGDNENDELSITDIEGPTALSIDEEGTWTVHVAGTHEGNLSYSVKWGDEGNALMRLLGADDEETQSSATFTHTYGDEGTYTPEFTVTDEDGNTVTKASASVSVGEDGELRIDSISPTSASVGAEVTIEGEGFDEDASVRIGRTVIDEVTVEDDTTITFTVPELDARAYNLVVRSDGERSNAVRFTVTEEVAGRVSVSGVSAPTHLEIGENGEWTVHADTNLDGNLRYSVEWGDEDQMAQSLMSAEATTQSSATFSHTYFEEGTYHPKFTVTGENGESASVSASVVVTDDAASSD